jgi:hypothetical protein
MSFKDLKPELMELQTTWGSQVQAAKAPKGAEGAPFPVKVLLEMEQPASCSHWDVEWLKVLLIIEGPELDKEDPNDLPIRVEFPQLDLPLDMRELMARMVQTEWKTAVAGSTEGPRWRLQQTLSWVQKNFDKLLRVIPTYLDWYMGADKNDVSQRRYTITIPPPVVVVTPAPVLKKKEEEADSDDSDPEDGGLSEEDKKARREAYKAMKAEQDRKRQIKEQQQEQQDDEKAAAEQARRKEEGMAARERGDVVKPSQKSKKEIEEMRKGKQGVRTSKTGSKATKFAGEGSAIERDALAAKKGGGAPKKK